MTTKTQLVSEPEIRFNSRDDSDEDKVTAIRFQDNEPKWVLRDDTDVGVMFNAYRTKVGGSDYLANCYIISLIKTSLMHDDVCKTFDEKVWLELCVTCDEKRGQHEPPGMAMAYLDTLTTPDIKAVRRALSEPIYASRFRRNESIRVRKREVALLDDAAGEQQDKDFACK